MTDSSFKVGIMLDNKKLLELKRDTTFKGELSTFIAQRQEVRTELLEQLNICRWILRLDY